VQQYSKSSGDAQKNIAEFYLSNAEKINNWDLVDLTASKILGHYLFDKDRAILYKLAESTSLWEQRIAVVSTYHFIKNMDFGDTLSLCEKLINHKHDLIHKATGWMLREAGKRDLKVLVSSTNTANQCLVQCCVTPLKNWMTHREKNIWQSDCRN
jgi:3-methyladenine DNA glycosylase AlkD